MRLSGQPKSSTVSPSGSIRAVLAGCRHVNARARVCIGAGSLLIGETQLAAAGHVAEFVDRAGDRARAAKRRQIGDDGIGRIHHRFVALEDLPRRVGRCEIDGIVEGIETGQPTGRADRGLPPADLHRIRQEHVGACQIDFHGITDQGGIELPRHPRCKTSPEGRGRAESAGEGSRSDVGPEPLTRIAHAT
jgi:hypothetical protein